jgi:hypothetical protein
VCDGLCPAQLDEFFEGGFTAEAGVAAIFLTAKGDLRHVVNRRTIER